MLREGSLDDTTQRKAASVSNAGVGYGAIKIFHVNSLAGQTRRLSKPYENRPDDFGVPPASSPTVLSADPTQVASNIVKDSRLEKTVIGGRWCSSNCDDQEDRHQEQIRDRPRHDRA
jgi:hypothetical protein